jgi:hypothetical protein
MGAQMAASHGKSFFSVLLDAARRAADYSRMQGLPRHYLDDAGLTPAEIDAALTDAGVVDRFASTRSLAHSV